MSGIRDENLMMRWIWGEGVWGDGSCSGASLYQAGRGEGEWTEVRDSAGLESTEMTLAPGRRRMAQRHVECGCLAVSACAVRPRNAWKTLGGRMELLVGKRNRPKGEPTRI